MQVARLTLDPTHSKPANVWGTRLTFRAKGKLKTEIPGTLGKILSNRAESRKRVADRGVRIPEEERV